MASLAHRRGDRAARSRLAAAVALLVALAYVPALATARNVVAADTKQYLYLDPGRLLRQARSMWDPSQFGGHVTHQQIGYLWPMGPYYWLTDRLGVPVWVAQRLWIGTVIALAGTGALWLARRLGLSPAGALVAAAAYQSSPYLLTYVNRTSVLLLPWAGLPWIIELTRRAARRGGWRHPALIALVVASIGGINATATALVAIGPAVWIVDATARRAITWRQALTTALRIGVCALATSLWWIVGLVVEGRYGANVLAYSETVQAVSTTSSATEVARGLGYWLFYGGSVDGRWNSASTAYLTNPASIALGFALALAGLIGLLLWRSAARRWLVIQAALGVAVAVGSFPPARPSPLARLVAGHLGRSTLVLALRSSTRAVPLVVLSLSIAIGAGVSMAADWRPRLRPLIVLAALAACVVNLPALWTGGYVDRLLRRPAAVPTWWHQAASALDARGTGRVLELPGQEFGAYRWGTTTDQLLPGLTRRPIVTRDLLPLGGDALMETLFALDQRFQDRIVEPAAIAPVARLLGATDVVGRLDAASERYRTPSANEAWATLADAPGLSAPVTFGPPSAPSEAPVVDETLLDAPSGSVTAPAAVSVQSVDEARKPVRLESVADGVLLDGSGDGIVDAAAAALVDGNGAARYAASLASADTEAAVATAGRVIVTDSNRARAQQWRGSQDTTGYTEDGKPTTFAADVADARLSVFPDAPDSTKTLALQRGGARITASAYGEPNAYRPEDRALFAMDGDPASAWRVGDRADPVGARLRVELDTPRSLSAITVVQQQRPANRAITDIVVRTDTQRLRVALDESSRASAGQVIALSGASTSVVELEIAATDVAAPSSFFGLDAVGIAELGIDGIHLDEIVRPPIDLVDALDAAVASSPDRDVAYVLTRQRVDRHNRWRHDPEPSLVREITTPRLDDATLTVTARLSAAASIDVRDSLMWPAGPVARASSTLHGSLAAAPSAAFDGDATTAWTSAFDDALGAWWETTVPAAQADAALAGATPSSITLSFLADANHSTPTKVHVDLDDKAFDVAVPPATADGRATVVLDGLSPSGRLRVTVSDTNGASTIDRRYGEQVALPIALAEVAFGQSSPARGPVTAPVAFDLGCRTDVLTVDGQPFPITLRGTRADAQGGEPLVVAPCGDGRISLAAGPHVIRSAPGTRTGIDVDRVVVRTVSAPTSPTSGPSAPTAAVVNTDPRTIVERRDATSMRLLVGPTTRPTWLVIGESYNRGWHASANGRDLGRPTVIDGGATAWLLPVSDADQPLTVTVRWRPQRLIDIALAVSLAAAMACAVLALPRRRPIAAASEPGEDDVTPAPWRRSGWVGPVALGVVSAVVIAPVYGAVIAGAALAARRSARSARLLGFAGPLLFALSGSYVVARQVVSRPTPGFGWPLATEAAHRPMLAAFAVAVASVLVRVPRIDDGVLLSGSTVGGDGHVGEGEDVGPDR